MRGASEVHEIAGDALSLSGSSGGATEVPSAFGVMRYQSLSPDCPLPIGTTKPCSKVCADAVDGEAHFPLRPPFDSSPPEFPRSRPLPPPRPPPSALDSAQPLPSTSVSPSRDQQSLHIITAPFRTSYTCSSGSLNGVGCSGDVLLQWGQKKRSRWSRASAAAASASEEASPPRRRPTNRIARHPPPSADTLMPTPTACGSYVRGSKLRAASVSNPDLNHRGAEERLAVQKRSNGDKSQRANGSASLQQSADAELLPASCEKPSSEQFEWPRIYVTLSRKEKEEDFFAMKGSKLPQRPKKRARNVDRSIQLCFPGLWLSELTKGRYEVREKKSVKKKRRGLKGMESMDSDSD